VARSVSTAASRCRVGLPARLTVCAESARSPTHRVCVGFLLVSSHSSHQTIRRRSGRKAIRPIESTPPFQSRLISTPFYPLSLPLTPRETLNLPASTALRGNEPHQLSLAEDISPHLCSKSDSLLFEGPGGFLVSPANGNNFPTSTSSKPFIILSVSIGFGLVYCHVYRSTAKSFFFASIQTDQEEHSNRQRLRTEVAEYI